MEQSQQHKIFPIEWSPMSSQLSDDYNALSRIIDDVELTPEAIALDGLLSDLKYMADRYESMANQHFENWHGRESVIRNTPEQSIVACGIYANKAEDMRDLVRKWKPNKK